MRENETSGFVISIRAFVFKPNMDRVLLCDGNPVEDRPVVSLLENVSSRCQLLFERIGKDNPASRQRTQIAADRGRRRHQATASTERSKSSGPVEVRSRTTHGLETRIDCAASEQWATRLRERRRRPRLDHWMKTRGCHVQRASAASELLELLHARAEFGLVSNASEQRSWWLWTQRCLRR